MEWLKRDDCNTLEEVICRNLNVRSKEEIEEWFKKSDSGYYRIPYVDEGISLISKYKNKHIHIVSDYDVDGRMASIIMYLSLVRIGCKDVIVRTPKRFTEGYGFKDSILDEIENNDSLIITLDNGIRSFDTIRDARIRGMSVLLTDHHLPERDDNGRAIIPPANVVIDPKCENGNYIYDGYCGAGVAYKIAEELLKGDSFLKSMLPYVAIATIADVMELREENYVFAKRGLEMLTARSGPPGIISLMDAFEMNSCYSTDVGFKLAPALNATGRMNDHDKLTLPLLAANNRDKGMKYARKVIEQNELRKEAVKAGVTSAERKLVEEADDVTNIIVVRLDDVKAGIPGIIAGRLTDQYNVPAIVFGAPDNNGVRHGSARSVEKVNIENLLRLSSDFLVSYGGHAQAAGVAVEDNNFEAFKKYIINQYKTLGCVYTPKEKEYYDIEILPRDIEKTLQTLYDYEPYGNGNPRPIFKIKNYRCTETPREIANHGVRMKGSFASCIGFGLWECVADAKGELPTYDIYGTLSWNEYKGRRYPQIEMMDAVRTDKKITTDFAEKLSKM